MINISNIEFVEVRDKKLSELSSGVYKESFETALKHPDLPDPKIGHVFDTFATNFSIFGLNALVSQQDITKSKHYFYLSALSRLRHALEYKDGAKSFYIRGISVSFEAIFCDATYLYPLFAKVEHPDLAGIEGKASWLSYVIGALYQQSLIQNWQAVGDLISQVESKGVLSKNKWFEEDLALYRALCENDSAKVEAALAKLLSASSVKMRNRDFKNTAMGKFMCSPGMWFAKLAWICGHEIEINHPLIISDLLPVRPLDSYDVPYDFLKGVEFRG